MNKVNFFLELWERLFTKSPKFFKIIQFSLIGVALLLELLTWVNGIWPMPSLLLPFIGHDSAIYVAVLALIAKLPVADPEHLDEKLKK